MRRLILCVLEPPVILYQVLLCAPTAPDLIAPGNPGTSDHTLRHI